MTFTPTFMGSVGFFLAYACIQAVVAGKSTRSIYLAYSAYLLFVLLYFVVHANFSHLYVGKHLEAPLFSGIVISYLLFAKALFRNRESYQYFRGIANSGIYTIVLCLLIEKAVHAWGEPKVLTQLTIIEGLLRAFVGALGLYAITYTYFKTPNDRYFSKYFMFGNFSVLLCGVVAIFFTLFSLSTPKSYSGWEGWRVINRLSIMQFGVLVEMLCFSVAITRRQSGLAPVPVTPPVNGKEVQASIAGASEPQEVIPKKIAFKTNKGFEIMMKSEIIFLQGGGNSANFIKLYREGQPAPIIVLQTLTNAHKALSEGVPVFERLHKSYLVNTEKISGLFKDQDGVTVAVMSNKMEVPVSAGKLADLKVILKLDES